MKDLRLLGYDFGASSGRAMLGSFDGDRLRVEEIHRFANDPVQLADRFVWDAPRLFFEMKQALIKLRRLGIQPDAIGIDTWGVDFGLLDRNGRLLGLPVHYRDPRNEGMMEKAFEIVPKEEIFRRTGLAFNAFNTLYQLLAMRLQDDSALDHAGSLLMMPDLLAYWLTGVKRTEYTIASTSQMIDPRTRDWDRGLLRMLDIPDAPLTAIDQAGSTRGCLLASIAEETGMADIPVVAVASHDTAAAVAAVPARTPGFAYISSGTWSLLGAEIREPLCTPEVMALNYTNEGGVDGTTRLLKNIMGLWIVQECKREWDRAGGTEDFGTLMCMAETAKPFLAVIDVDDPSFLSPGNMPGKVREYCLRTGQRAPETKGEICRVVYEGLALKYRWAVEQMEEKLLKRKVDVMHIVGGGSKNALLNRMTACALGRPVEAGPSEGTVIGNLLVQAMALGEIGTLSQLREVVSRSFPTETTLPQGEQAAWEDAYGRLLRLMEA